MSNEQILKFDDLGLKIGQIIQIHPNPKSHSDLFDCLLVGCLPEEAVILSVSPKTGEFPTVEEGQRVAIRIMSANGVALFSSTVLFISDVPTFMVYIDFPRTVKFHQVRNASRVDVALPVLVSGKSTFGATGKVSDISIGGAQVELSEDIGDVNDEVTLKGKFQISEIRRVIELSATIRRKKAMSTRIVYGVEFREADEEKLIVLFGYIFNSMAFGHVQTIK